MEHTLLVVLVSSSVLTMLLSFVLRDIVVLRLISALMLLMTAYCVPQAQLYVGFGSQNAIPYYGTQSGDPGTKGEIEVFVYGFIAFCFFQFTKFVELFYKGLIRKDGTAKVPGVDNTDHSTFS